MEVSITLIIVVITSLVSLIANSNSSLKSKMLFNAYKIHHDREYYRLFSHALIHSGLMHLAINMWVLYMFGNYVENELSRSFPEYGQIAFLGLYIGGVLFSSSNALRRHKNNPNYNSLGASGAVAAILYSYIIINPIQEICLYFMLCVPAFVFGILYLWYEYSMDKKSRGRIAHDAHFLGAIFGVLFMLVLNYNYILNFIEDIKFYISSFF